MRKSIILSLAVIAAAVVPVAAHAAGTTFTGVVVAKEAKRGTFVVTNRSGSALTAHGRLAKVKLGDRVSIGGTALRDGTFRVTSLKVVGQARTATVRGVVVKRLATRTLVSTGHSVIVIGRHVAKRALASRGLAPGSVARFGVSVSGSGVRELSATTLGTTNTVRVEGRVVTLAPFVVDVEGLPITVGLGTATLPSTLAVGAEVELTVTVDANNVFTLVSVDEFQAAEQPSAAQDQPGLDDNAATEDDQGDDDGAHTQSQPNAGGDDSSGHDGGDDGGSSGGGGGGGG